MPKAAAEHPPHKAEDSSAQHQGSHLVSTVTQQQAKASWVLQAQQLLPKAAALAAAVAVVSLLAPHAAHAAAAAAEEGSLVKSEPYLLQVAVAGLILGVSSAQHAARLHQAQHLMPTGATDPSFNKAQQQCHLTRCCHICCCAAAAISFILHLDKHMSAMIQQHGTATYAILWTIVFCETGLVLTPFLPGDSLLFAAGAFAGMYYWAGLQMQHAVQARALWVTDAVERKMHLLQVPSLSPMCHSTLYC